MPLVNIIICCALCVVDISEVWYCHNLQQLNLANNKLVQLCNQIEACGKLADLNLSNNALLAVTMCNFPLVCLICCAQARCVCVCEFISFVFSLLRHILFVG